MKDISFAIIIGTVITVVGLFIEDRFFNDSEPPIIQVQTSRDIGGLLMMKLNNQKRMMKLNNQNSLKNRKLAEMIHQTTLKSNIFIVVNRAKRLKR